MLVVLFGTYIEKVYVQENILAILVYAPITMLIYYLIFVPAITILPHSEICTIHSVLRYITAFMLLFVPMLPFLGLLSELRLNYRNNFPPCSMVSYE